MVTLGSAKVGGVYIFYPRPERNRILKIGSGPFPNPRKQRKLH